MRDSDLVASIVAGNPEGLAVAYDRYAGDLYGYCRSLLQEPDDAADAVQDTFVIAASKLAGLRDPERLRAWLFAVARNECLRRLKSRHAAPLHDAPEPADGSADVGIAAERAETVALVRAAMAGLNDGERDVINQLWHGLEVPEVADVLGVSRSYAYTLYSRARDQLEASVAVLLVGRSGRRDCAALDSLLGDWDGRLTARLRRRVGRHIERCRVCSDRRRRELTPAMLYGLTPGAVLAMAALRGPAAAAHAAHLGNPMSGARYAVLRHVQAGPHGAGHRAALGHSTHSFGISGFPKAPHHGLLGFSQLPHLPLAAAGGTAVAAGAAATVVMTTVMPALNPVHSALGSLPTASELVPAAAPTVPGSGGATPGTAAPGSGKSTAGPGVTASRPASQTASGGPGPTATSPIRVLKKGPAPSLLDTTSAPSQASTSGAPTSAAPSPTPTVTVTPTPSADGTLSVSPSTVVLSALNGGSLTLTASGGPVSWSISEPTSLIGSLFLSPSSGTLSAGQTTTVTLSVSQLASLDTDLTVEPGDHPVTVLLAVG